MVGKVLFSIISWCIYFFSIISFRSLCSEKNIGKEKNSLYHSLGMSVIIENTFQFTVNAKYNICFGKQFIQNGGNICFKQGIIVWDLISQFTYISPFISTWNNKITFQTIQNVTHRKCGDVFVQIFQYVSGIFLLPWNLAIWKSEIWIGLCSGLVLLSGWNNNPQTWNIAP